MFTSEDGAYPIIDTAVNKYENYFGKEFPLYEYVHITKNDRYDFSLKGAERLRTFIDGCIDSNNPVEVPEDYHDRLY